MGDEAFTRKCLDKIGEFRRRGKTILIVTHSLGLVEKMCDDVLWLRRGPGGRPGRSQARGRRLSHLRGGGRGGAPGRGPRGAGRGPVVPAAPGARPPSATATARAAGAAARSRSPPCACSTTAGRERHVYMPGETLTVALSVRASAPVEDFVFGVGLFSAEGVNVYGTNTDLEDFKSRIAEGEGEVRLTLDDLRLVEGTYLLDVAAHRRDGTPYDYHRGLYSFRVKSRIKDVGLYRPAHHWAFTGGRAPPARPPAGARRDLPTTTPDRASRSISNGRDRGPWAAGWPSAAAWRGGPARRLHQRLLRPAAPRPRGAPRGGSRPGRPAGGGHQQRRLGARPQGARPAGRARA